LATSPHFPTDKSSSSLPPRPANTDESTLMVKLAAGDQNALMDVYDRYSCAVYSLSLHVLRSPQAAEDLMQDVFLLLFRKAALYNPALGSLRSWLMVLTRHQAIDRLRRESRELPLSDSVSAIELKYPVLPASPSCLMIRSIFDKLPSEQRDILQLAYFGGLTQVEIARQTGKPLGTVKTQIRSALQRLRRLLAIDGKVGTEKNGSK
jgi:DNA-directed RNA polymerase specialized sigma24 family protein